MKDINDTLIEEENILEEIKLAQEEKESRKTRVVSDEEFKKLKANSDLLYMAKLAKFAKFCESGECRKAERDNHGEEEN